MCIGKAGELAAARYFLQRVWPIALANGNMSCKISRYVIQIFICPYEGWPYMSINK